MTQELINLLYYIFVGILIVFNICAVIYSKIKSKKIKKALEADDRERANEIERQRNPFEKLLEIIEVFMPTAIKVAEASATTGKAKKALVMAEMLLKCNEEGVNFEEHKDHISEAIDRAVAMAKEVNTGALIPVGEACPCDPLSHEEVDGVINNG